MIYGGLPATEEILARNRNLYQGEVAYVDREIGELLECSEKTIWARVQSARKDLAKKLRCDRLELVAAKVKT